ncbi:MAG: hypothetical protein L3J39_19460 [Verrucomicrobiales bacterium]|nr:hypothetical protein [Verrucomicrobiales bacterium]
MTTQTLQVLKDEMIPQLIGQGYSRAAVTDEIGKRERVLAKVIDYVGLLSRV